MCTSVRFAVVCLFLPIVSVGCGKPERPDVGSSFSRSATDPKKTDIAAEKTERPVTVPSGASAPRSDESTEAIPVAENAPPSGTSITSNAQTEAPQQITKNPTTYTAIYSLINETNHTKTATEALALIDRFVTEHALDEDQARLFAELRTKWKKRVDQRDVVAGSQQGKPKAGSTATKMPKSSADEFGVQAGPADDLVSQAIKLIAISHWKQAEPLLVRAASADRKRICAPFILGMLNTVVGANEPRQAERHFKNVLLRVPNHPPALNNLAITEVKLQKYSSALGHWRTALHSVPKAHEVSHNLGRLIAAVNQHKIGLPATLLRRFSLLYAEAVASGKGAATQAGVGWLYSPLVLPRPERSGEKSGRRDSAGERLRAMGAGTAFVVADQILLTNRHVIEDDRFGSPDAVRILDPADPQHARELDASILAVSDDCDLALVRCDQVTAPAIPLATEIPQRQTEVIVLGFPMGEAFRRTVTSTRGTIAALPDPSNDQFLVYDATTNPGNSGGPVCDRRGSAIAVHTMGYAFQGKMAGGIPSQRAVEFIQQHRPSFTVNPSATGAELDWPVVDKTLSQSIVMLLTYYREFTFGLDQIALKPGMSQDYLQDLSCVVCNGTGQMRCPSKRCVKGRITITQRVQTGFNPLTKQPVYQDRRFKSTCPTCRGRNTVDCLYCENGIDRGL